MKGQIKTPEKELNEMQVSNLPQAEYQTLVIRVLKELSEDLNSIKKIQKNKNNLQENNSKVEEVKN